MPTAILLDDDVVEAAQALARASDRPLEEVLSEIARLGLRTQIERANGNDLPVFEITADSGVIPSGRARQLLAEDGA